MNMLSKHFSVEELTFSDTGTRLGLNNSPPQEVYFNLARLSSELLELVRDVIGKPLIITSGYRSLEVNTAIGGAKTSEHMDGRAADFKVAGMTPYEVCRKLEVIKWLEYNQLIHEFGVWTHISVPHLGEKPKLEKLTAKRVDGKTVYTTGIVPV